MTIRLIQPRSEADWAAARRLLEEYARSLNLDLSFQNFAHEMEHLASEYAPPTGAFRLAEEKGLLLGCVGVRRFSGDIGEIKRLYVIPTARGRGVGLLLAQSIMTAAKQTWIRPPVAGYIAVHEGGSRVVRVPWVQAYHSVSIQPRPRDCLPAAGASMKTSIAWTPRRDPNIVIVRQFHHILASRQNVYRRYLWD
jgi:GNAT superfamily N-acetyltransferase